MSRSRRGREDMRMPLAGLIVLIALSSAWRESLGMKIATGIAAAVGIALVFLVPKWWRERKYRALTMAGVDTMDPHEFEAYVSRLLEHQGYKTRVTPRSGDHGVDVVARTSDRSYAVQVKRHRSSLNNKCVQEAVAGKKMYSCTHAMVVTNSTFTDGARHLAQVNECELVDRDLLARWITEFQRAGK